MALLTLWIAILLGQPRPAGEPAAAAQVKAAVVRPPADPQIDKQIDLVKNLLMANNLEKAEVLLKELLGQFPYEGMLYFLQGDLYLYRQQPLQAMLEYKKAVELNPDLLDKKMKIFQGKKIKKTVEEARLAVEAALAANPGDRAMRENRTVVYYMLRLLAGSCG